MTNVYEGESGSAQLELVEASAVVVALQDKPKPSNVAPYFNGTRRPATARKSRNQVYAVGGCYHMAPAPGVELAAILFEQANHFAARQAGVPVTPGDTRALHLRTAVLLDRLALESDNPQDVVAANRSAWVLQHWDRDHRIHVRGEWQPDAVHWSELTADPESGCTGYVRQEYALWRRTRPGARRG